MIDIDINDIYIPNENDNIEGEVVFEVETFNSIPSNSNKIEGLFNTNSLENTIIKPYEIAPEGKRENNIQCKITTIECDSTISYLSDKLDKTPCGIIECPVSCIGATYLELQSPRNSIILFSTPEEALQHSQVIATSLCIDNLYGNIKEEITLYKTKVEWKKFIVSTSSLNTLGLLLHDEFFDYFFMIRDMEELQANNNYLNAEVLDYYLKFSPNNRCIYTTDHLAFTHPLLKNEPRYIIYWKYPQHKNITLYPCANITGRIKTIIEKLPIQDKIIIVYPSARQSKLCILNLKEKYQEECGIICSPNKQIEAGKYHIKQERETPDTSKRITFWCFNKLRKGIAGKAHLIIVSDTRQWNTLFSLKQIINLTKEETSSNHLIHNTRNYRKAWLDEITLMIERGTKVTKLLNIADELSSGDKNLTRLFSIVQNMLKEKFTGRLQGRFSPISLIRKNIENKWEVAYMKLDNLLLRINLYKNYYNSSQLLETAFKNYYIVTLVLNTENQVSNKQQEIEKEEKKQHKELTQKERLKVLDKILQLHISNQFSERILLKNCYSGESTQRKVCKQVLSLSKYIDVEEAILCLKELKSGNNIGFKNLNNAVVFWALEENHALKLAVYEAFKVGNKYTNEEIESKMQPIIYYHLHLDFTNKGRKLITLLRCFFKTNRPKKEYIILSKEKFTSHQKRISSSETNLLNFFNI